MGTLDLILRVKPFSQRHHPAGEKIVVERVESQFPEFAFGILIFVRVAQG